MVELIKKVSWLRNYCTTINMAKSPDIIMQIPGHKFLSRWLHGEILSKEKAKRLNTNIADILN